MLNDGWFGRRNDDTCNLGDWIADARKYPDGFGPLIACVRSLNMRFGLWFEPGMVNPGSDLYRAHPDWALGPQDWALGPQDQVPGGQQMVLNMVLEPVRTYLCDRISAVLSAHDIGDINWDHNRVRPKPDAAQRKRRSREYSRMRRTLMAFCACPALTK